MGMGATRMAERHSVREEHYEQIHKEIWKGIMGRGVMPIISFTTCVSCILYLRYSSSLLCRGIIIVSSHPIVRPSEVETEERWKQDI